MKNRFSIYLLAIAIGLGLYVPQSLVADELESPVACAKGSEKTRDYIRLCVKAGDLNKAQSLAEEYFAGLSDAQLLLPENWFLFDERYQLFESGQAVEANMAFLVAHASEFLSYHEFSRVYGRVATHYRKLALEVIRGVHGDRQYDIEQYQQELIIMPDFPEKRALLAQLEMAKAVCEEDVLRAGNILVDELPYFTASDQQVIVPFLNRYGQHPRLDEVFEQVMADGSNENLISYLKEKGYVQSDEIAEGSERYDHVNLKNKFGSTVIIPFFHPNQKKFWYLFEDANHEKDFFAFDAEKGKYELYDDVLIDSLLKQMEIDPTYKNFEPGFEEDGLHAFFSVGGKRFEYNSETKEIIELEALPLPEFNWGVSPDKAYKVIEQDYNLFVQNLQDSAIVQLTRDGSSLFSYAVADLTWVADHQFVVMRADHRGVRKMSVTNSLQQVPVVREYEFELPGDTAIVTQHLALGDAQAMTLQTLPVEKWKGQQISPVRNRPGTGAFYFLRTKRTRDMVELCRVNPADGSIDVLIHEESKPYINEDLFNCQVLEDDIIFWSDRTGWGQYYRYDKQGKLKNAITKGDWTVAKIVSIDTLARQMYFYGYGHEKDVNPNYRMLYRVGFNGKGLTLLTPADAHHTAFISPDRNLVVDSYSRIDLDPVAVVRDAIKGTLIDTLETPDLSKLYEYGWQKPETFVVKAADAETDLYGIMWKPFDFDPVKKYPVISQVYPGPQTETVWTEFTVMDRYSNVALAQRGFVVVCFGHRGGTPFRNKKYASFGYGNMRDYPLADDKYGLEQLIQRHDYLDGDKVGIVGHSGGAFMAVAALCTYPDFYKAAVSSSGNHDNSIYHRNWGELYNGISEDLNFEVGTTMELVNRLKGKLLLVTGESDQNVHPANTYKLVSELIKEGKQFEMLVLPGQGHHFEEPYKSYFENRKRDFFEEALKNDSPPNQ